MSGCRSARGCSFGGACLLFGIWLARFVGLLPPDAPAGETLGVGLASGLMVVAAVWAAIGSGGRSSFTPVAVGFAVAIVLAVVAAASGDAPAVSAGAGDGRDVGADDGDPDRRDPIRTAQRPRRWQPSAARRFVVVDRAALRIDDDAQPARRRPADRDDRRRVLRRPRQGPGGDRHRDEHLHVRVLGSAGPAGADLVPLGRAVARRRDDRDLRDRAAGRSLSRGPAAAAAGGRRADRHDRPPHQRQRLAAGLPLRVRRLPLPDADPVASPAHSSASGPSA